MAGSPACPVTEGWKERIISKILYAAGAGTAVGSVLAALQARPILPTAGRTGLSFAICFGCYAVALETTRTLRCADSPANSVVGGAAAGYGLFAAFRGQARAVPAALACGALGGLAHLAADKWPPGFVLQRVLYKLDLVDDPGDDGRPKVVDTEGWVPSGRWSWLPIKKLSDEEWAEYQRKKAEDFDKRIEKSMYPPTDSELEASEAASEEARIQR